MYLASFDVFDTVVTRAVGSPASVFLLLGRRLAQMRLIECSPEAFARARFAAEARARANAGGEEVHLDGIYAELSAAFGWQVRQRQRIGELECDLEDEILRIVPEAAARVQDARTAGASIAYLSDMYLPARVVEAALARRGLFLEGDLCWVSSERGRTKRTGHLFDDLRTYAPGSTPIKHCGNDLETDIRASRRSGIHADLFDAASPTRYEIILEQHAWSTEGLASAMAGAARLARLGVPVADAREAVVRDVAAGVVAPVLTGFVLWILHRARQHSIRRLYFISRDGQVLLKLARTLAPKLGLACEMRYLYGSRQAWHLPALTQIGESELSWIMDDTDFLSIRSVLRRVEVTPDAISGPLVSAGFGAVDWDRNLERIERVKLRDVLRENVVREAIGHSASERRGRLLEYLRQEGLLDGKRAALVDLGWRGRLQDSLAAVLAFAGAPAPRGLYFGLTSTRGAREPSEREAYFFDRRQRIGFYDAVPGISQMMEMFCAGDHGLTIGYRCEDRCIVPVLAQERNQAVLDWGLELVQRTVSAFAEHLVVASDLVNPWGDVREAGTELLRAFWLNPSSSEARVWGAFPCEDDQGGTYSKPIAVHQSWRDVLSAFATGTIRPAHRGAWLCGSIAISSPMVRASLAASQRVVPWRRRAGKLIGRRPGAGSSPTRSRLMEGRS